MSVQLFFFNILFPLIFFHINTYLLIVFRFCILLLFICNRWTTFRPVPNVHAKSAVFTYIINLLLHCPFLMKCVRSVITISTQNPFTSCSFSHPSVFFTSSVKLMACLGPLFATSRLLSLNSCFTSPFLNVLLLTYCCRLFSVTSFISFL